MAANYYEILNVPKDADSKAICEAYKKLALKWHPDKNLDNIDVANQRFLEISQAYQVLSDQNKRMKYDHAQNCDEFSDDDDDDDFESFFEFINPEMLFRHFFEHFERRVDFHSRRHYNYQRDDIRNRRGDDRRDKKEECKNHFESDCTPSIQTRMVNGKQWMTKTTYENGNKIVTRYEDGELISKQVNGVNQPIKK